MLLSHAADLLVTGLFLLGSFLTLAGARSTFAAVRTVEDTPTATIRAAAQGRVELKGRLATATPLVAPLSGEPCGFWMLTAERWVKDGRRSRWVSLGAARSEPDWLELTDGTGTCLLAVPDATFSLRHAHTEVIDGGGLLGLGKHFPPAAQDRINAVGRKRVVEHRVPVDAELYAIGLFRSLSSSDSPFADDWTQTVLRQGLAAPSYARLAADMAVAVGGDLRAGAEARWQQRMRALEGIGPDLPLAGTVTVHTLRRDDRRGRSFPLIISDRPEAGVTRDLRRQAWLMVLAAVVLAGAGIATLAATRPQALDAVLGFLG